MNDADRKAAIGFRAGCGCPTFALVLGYGTQKQDEADVARAIKQGHTIKVMHPDEARKLPNFLNCPHRVEGDTPADIAKQIVAAHR